MSPNLMSKLVVRGGGALVDEALKRNGWNGTSPVISVVATAELTTGTIRGMRYETRGSLPEVKFEASDLWDTAERGITVLLNFDNLGVLSWVTTRECRNQSHWFDGTTVKTRFIKDDGTLLATDDDIEGAGIRGFAVRFTAIPIAVDTVALNAGLVPMGKRDLDEKLAAMELTLCSPRIPTMPLKMLTVGSRAWNAHPVGLRPQEGVSDKVGWGHLPLIEMIGSGRLALPDSDKLEKEMTDFMRGLNATYNVGSASLRDLYSSDAAFTSRPTGTISHVWPEYQGPVPGPQSRSEG